MGLGGVEEDGEGIEEGGVEAVMGDGDGGGGVVGVDVEDEVRAAAAAVASGAVEVAAAGTEEVPAGVEVEADHEDDYGE